MTNPAAVTELLPDTLRLPALDAAVVRADTLRLPAPAPVTSECITGQPCALGCGLFCALEPEFDDLDELDEFDDLVDPR